MTHPEVERFMTAKCRGTNVTALDLFKIGESLLNTLSSTYTLGHTNPAHSLDYTQGTGFLWTDVVRDYTAWVSRRIELAPGCEERLRALVVDGGWQRLHLEQAAASLGLSA
jgi:hypothetical protein